MGKYAVGVDFGTMSARALLIDAENGAELEQSVYQYPHGVIDQCMPDGSALPPNWALQDPQDYLEALGKTVRDVIGKSGVDTSEVIGIGIDFTSCTVLPVKQDGTPLCTIPEYKNQKHAYVKLWKHHSAQPYADLLNKMAEKNGEEWLKLYGDRISSEWLVPKVMQIADEAPEIYKAADKIIEAGDWVVWQLCGEEVRSACNAGYKAIWQHNSYPDKHFFKSLNPIIENLASEKLSKDIRPIGTRAGFVTRKASEFTGLRQGTAVAVGIADAHASVPACRIYEPGKMLMIMGTSTCHMLLSEKEMGIPGICGIVKDGIIPGYYGYEAGQSCVGDHFSWFVDNCIPASYTCAAKKAGMNIHQYLRSKAEALKAGESGLLALDWWNGVRSVLMDSDLSGMIIGLTLQTKPEEIYRALIEATAFGTRQIIETFESTGVPVNELYAAGGIASKDPMTMQIYADICNRNIRISGSSQSGALGSAILGAVAAGPEKSGLRNVKEASEKLGSIKEIIYMPDSKNAEIYDSLFGEYRLLHEYFGRGGNNVMKTLKKLRT